MENLGWIENTANTVTYPLGDLAAGQSKTVKLKIHVDGTLGPGTISNTFAAISAQGSATYVKTDPRTKLVTIVAKSGAAKETASNKTVKAKAA